MLGDNERQWRSRHRDANKALGTDHQTTSLKKIGPRRRRTSGEEAGLGVKGEAGLGMKGEAGLGVKFRL